MKNILLILVGGTICTTLNEDNMLSVSDKAGLWLKTNFEQSDSFCKNQVHFDLTENLFILSENMTVEKWNLMLDTYRKHMAKNTYDGVIFAHGTDTLAYSAALFSLLFCGTNVPVFFVSANERLDSARSNGNANFRCAVECIFRGITPNVYVAYRNLSDGQMYLHLASRLEQCKNYSEDFYSVGAVNVTDISEENASEYLEQIEKRFPQKGIKPIFANREIRLTDCVLMLMPYVGMRYDVYDYSRFRAVLHGTYHSGTACSEKTEKVRDYGVHSLLYLLDRCAESDTAVYLSPSKKTGEIYETVGILAGHKPETGNGLSFLYGYTTEMAYAKLLLAYSVLECPQQRDEFLNKEYNFERIG